MQAGLIGAWDALEFALTLTPTRGRDVGATRHHARLQTLRTVDEANFANECLLEIRAWRQRAQGFQDYDETAWRVILFGQSYYGSQATFGAFTLKLRFIQPRWYWVAEGAWLFTCADALVLNASDTVLQSFGPLQRVGTHLAPTGLPLMGVPPLLIPDLDFPARYTNESIWDDTLPSLRWAGTHRSAAEGGWRVQVGNQWYAFPVDLEIPLPSQEPPNCGYLNPCALSYTAPDLQAPNTYQGKAEVVHRYRVHTAFGCLGENRRYSGLLMLLPSLERACVRLIEPSASVARRLAFPQVRKQDYNRCVYERLAEDAFCDQTYEAQPEVLPTYPDTVDALLTAPDGFEAPLQARLRAPVQWQFEWEQRAPEGQLTENNDATISSICAFGYYNGRFVAESYPRVTPAETPAVYRVIAPYAPLPLLREWACYLNTWAHPHWLYLALYNDWALGVPLTPAPAQDYWALMRTQWLGEPMLPLSKRTKQRAIQTLGVGEDSWQSAWSRASIADNLYGWLGACRFDALPMPAVEQKTLTSASQNRWSAFGATLMFGSNLLVTPTQATSTLEFDLTDWQVEPYLYPALCSAVRVQVAGVYNRVRVYLVNCEGDAHELQPDPNDATLYRYTPAADSVYAGDWAQSYAAHLTGYSETGVDLKPQGRSSSVMSDPARRTLWELLHSQTPAKLRIVVEQLAPTPYTLVYPTFYREFNESKAYPLTAQTQAVVDHDALWRYGGLNFQLATPVPQLRPVHQSPTVYDALCLRNLLYRGESYQHQMAADTNAFYDSVEWTGALADLRMDTRSLIYPLHRRYAAPYLSPEPLLVLINAYREVPPLMCLPRRKRDAETLAEVGEWGQWQYLISPLRRYYVGLDAPIHLHRVEYDTNGNETNRQIVTTYLEAFRRAHVTYHELALENDEVITRWNGQPLNSPRYLVHSKGDDWARATPFHGYSAVIWVFSQVPSDYLPIEVDGRRRWLIWGAGDTLYAAHIAQFAPWLTAPHSVDAWRWIAWDSRHGAYLLTAQVGNEWRVYLSHDGGETIQEVLSMQAEALLCESYSAAGLWVALYQTSAGVFVRYSGDGGQSWSSPQTVLLDDVAMTQTPTGLAYDERGGLLLMTYQAGNQRHVAVSYDIGATWETVL